jgi:hypothetical protein
MSNHERRSAVALDDAFNYCRWLETKSEPPQLYKLCNAIRTLDLALAGQEDSPIPMSLCTDAWSRVRDSLFNNLVSSFAGHFEVFDSFGNQVDTSSDWPESGTTKFFPARIARRNDGYEGRLERLAPSVVTVLRWCFAEHRQNTVPSDFDNQEEPLVDEGAEQAEELLDRLYQVCEEEATEGKKKAHRKWWQLYWEANSCPNKRQRHQLEKQMVALEGIWGKPEE